MYTAEQIESAMAGVRKAMHDKENLWTKKERDAGEQVLDMLNRRLTSPHTAHKAPAGGTTERR